MDFTQRPLYRGRSHMKFISGQAMHDYYTTFFEVEDVVSDKVTHQGRRQTQQEMYEALISSEDVAKFVGYADPNNKKMNKDQGQSYLTVPHPGCVTDRAGGDHRHPENHSPAWSTVPVPPELLNAVIPELLSMRQHVHDQYDRYATREERKNRRLYMARGAIDAMVFDVENAFRMAAAHPLDADTLDTQTGKVDMTALPIFKTFQDSPVGIFRHPVFTTAAFQSM